MIRLNVFVLLLCFLLTYNLQAQWIQMNGPYGGSIHAITSDSTNLYAGTFGAGVVLSTNNGKNWSAINIGLTCLEVTSLAVKANKLFAGTYSGGIFLSTNNGLTWTATDSGLVWVETVPDTLIPTMIGLIDNSKMSVQSTSSHDTLISVKFISSLTLSKNNLFAGTFGSGIYRFIDSGQYWIAVDSGLGKRNWIFSLASTDSDVFAATETGLYYTNDSGRCWISINNGLVDGIINHNIYAVAIKGNTYFAGTDARGVFRSTDNGLNWEEVNNGLTNRVIFSLMVKGENIFVGTEDGVFLSTNNGSSWTSVNKGLKNEYMSSTRKCNALKELVKLEYGTTQMLQPDNARRARSNSSSLCSTGIS